MKEPEYKHGPPSADAEAIDAPIAEAMTCRVCGSSCHYDAYHNPKTGSYIALAICDGCGKEYAF